MEVRIEDPEDEVRPPECRRGNEIVEGRMEVRRELGEVDEDVPVHV